MIKKRIKETTAQLKPSVRQAIAPTILATLIFFLMYFFFGQENTMISPFVTLSFLRFRTMRNHYECMVKNFSVFFVLAVAAYFAVINLPLCIVINALSLFWIAYILIDEYHPDNYFPAGMALIFFQTAPATTPAALGNRLLALLAAFAVVFVFVFVLSKIRNKKDPLPEYIRQGFENCRKQLELCESWQKETGPRDYDRLIGLRGELVEINKTLCDEIYARNRAGIRPKGKTNWYCRFVLFFQVINYQTLYFEDGQNLADAKGLYRDFLTQFETVTPTADYHRIHVRLRRPDIRSFRLRFALRQVIVLTPCLAFALVSGLPNVYWIVISAFFMMIPFTDHTLLRIRQRVLGTLSGIVICLLLFTLFDGFAARVVILCIANFFIYGSTAGYGVTVAYITCSALALQTLNAPMHLLLGYRLLYTLIGAGIALLANRFVFPIHLKHQIAYLSEKVEEIERQMDHEPVPDAPPGGRDKWRNDQRILQCFMLSKRIKTMCDLLPGGKSDFDYNAFEKRHIFTMERYLSRQFLGK